MRALPLLLAATVLVAAATAWAQTPVEAARALVARYHEDPARLDRARDLLDAALTSERRVETMVMLSRVQFLIGDVRATSLDEKLAAYDRGREIGRRAVELAPKSPDAHLWYAINTARWGETKGVLRSLFLLPTIREELTVLLELDPRSVRAHVLVGNVLLEVPGFAGGDRAKAEEHFKKALEIDPRFTDARRELTRVVNETRPSVVADWTVKDAPRARKLLESIKDRT